MTKPRDRRGEALVEDIMKAFWAAMLVAVIVSVGAALVLERVQTPSEAAYATQGVRL